MYVFQIFFGGDTPDVFPSKYPEGIDQIWRLGIRTQMEILMVSATVNYVVYKPIYKFKVYRLLLTKNYC